MWKHTRQGKHYLTAQAKAYYEHLNWLVRSQGFDHKVADRLHVVCRISPPDKRRRDLDNVWKVVSDGMTKSRVWLDDQQIDKLELHRLPPGKPGWVQVFVYLID